VKWTSSRSADTNLASNPNDAKTSVRLSFVFSFSEDGSDMYIGGWRLLIDGNCGVTRQSTAPSRSAL
jgi:hypothetical protein